MKGFNESRRNAGRPLHALIAACAFLPFAACSGTSGSKTSARAPYGRYDAPPEPAPARVPANADAIIHMFNVPFARIEAELPAIAAAGFGNIQISPPQLSNGSAWWGRYQPLDYRVIDGPLGDEAALRRLVKAAEARGIGIIVDLVLNHMANLGADHDLEYPPKWAREKYKLPGLFSAFDFHHPFCIRNWGDAKEVRDGRLCGGGSDTGLPDLRHENDYVVKVQRDFIAKLNGIGVKGYRVDAVKHMDIDAVNRVLTPGLTKDKFVFGEVIAFKGNFDADLEPYLRETRMGYMDFPLLGTLKDAFAPQGSLRALEKPVESKGALAWDRSVAFAVNHDIPNNEGFRYLIMDETDERLAYAYITGRSEGVPHMMSDLGKADGLTTDRWKDYHRRPHVAGMLRFHNAVHGTGSRVAWVNDCVIVLERGNKGVVGINKCGHGFKEDVRFALTGESVDTLSGKTVRFGGSTPLEIPARSAVMFLAAGAASK